MKSFLVFFHYPTWPWPAQIVISLSCAELPLHGQVAVLVQLAGTLSVTELPRYTLKAMVDPVEPSWSLHLLIAPDFCPIARTSLILSHMYNVSQPQFWLRPSAERYAALRNKATKLDFETFYVPRIQISNKTMSVTINYMAIASFLSLLPCYTPYFVAHTP